MDRQGIDRRPTKPENTAKAEAEMAPGRRAETPSKSETVEGNAGGGFGKAMDAVREVVHSEGIVDNNEGQRKAAGEKAMDAIRDIVGKE